MFTIFSSPTHILPVNIQAPTQRDPLGDGANGYRRKWTRPLRRWEINIPAAQENLDPVLGLLDYAQGDTPMWFDGAGTIEVTEPAIVGIGDGVITDFRLPHRHIFAASLVVYINCAVVSAWTPLGSSVVADSIRFTSPPAANAQITAKYRRRAKVVFETETEPVQERTFRSLNDNKQTRYRLRVYLQEVAT